MFAGCMFGFFSLGRADLPESGRATQSNLPAKWVLQWCQLFMVDPHIKDIFVFVPCALKPL